MPYATSGAFSQSPLAGGIEITEAQYQEARAGVLIGKEVSIDGGFSVEFPPEPEPEPEPEPTLADLQAAKLGDINRAYSIEMAAILDQYPKAETLSFDKQESEARAWLADNSAATPFIDAMLIERPLDKGELVSRIIDKADAFTLACGTATGKRQRLEDAIALAAAADLDAIQW